MRFTPALPHRCFAHFVRDALFARSVTGSAHAWPQRSGRRRSIARAFNGAVCAATGVLTFVSALSGATAETAPSFNWPERTVTIVVPWPPGATPDGIARIASVKLAARLHQTFVVENRPGAASATGIASVAKAAPDGYTFMAATTSMVTNPTLRKRIPYDPEKDFVPLAMVSLAPFVLVVNPSLPVRSLSDLIALAGQKPGELSYGSGGPGHSAHIDMELLQQQAGIQMTHVPYGASIAAMNDVIAGHIHLTFADIQPALPLIAEGRVRALGVSSRTRVASAPQIPPIAESGLPDFEAMAWVMFLAPARTPPQIVTRLRSELVAMMDEPDVQAWIAASGQIPPRFQAPDELQRYLSAEVTHWRDVLTRLGLAGSQ
jgi:tripartite-type tricarboxylate transporter receptor subunit TctC